MLLLGLRVELNPFASKYIATWLFQKLWPSFLPCECFCNNQVWHLSQQLAKVPFSWPNLMIASCVQNSPYRASMYFISNTSHQPRGEVKDPSDWRSFGTERNIERLPSCVSLDESPLLNLRLSFGGFSAKYFLQCLYTVAGVYWLNCFTMLLIFMPACWCKLAI